jgi:hypothetical protein
MILSGKMAQRWWIILWSACSATLLQGEISYNKEVLPILASKCFACHGADAAKREAGLRLDNPKVAYAERDGVRAIVPGDLEGSALVARIFAKNDDELMPPQEEKNALTPREKRILHQWITEGARYEKHWAFTAPSKSAPPKGSLWGRNPIDLFIEARLLAEGLKPQQRATTVKRLRRVSMDLSGLPPNIKELDSCLDDSSPNVYERFVDRLLASPRYGERMATWWLDSARYGDSHGYDNDLENAQWPWRNWVLEAFNSNMPYDRFTMEQLAGDLLPNARHDQILATGFNRNHRIQTEGGAIDEEWRTEYVIDRVETMGTVFLGLTLSCARCHDHKYDPVSQKEFYQLFALFNRLDEKGFINNLRGSAKPRMRYQATRFEAERKGIETQAIDNKTKERALAALEQRYPHVMIMRDEIPRQTFVLNRGQYDSPGTAVEPGLPTSFSPRPEGSHLTRLDLANWLVNDDHPLVARVVVNRLWEQLFGTGIVKSSENLGVQADWPSHPALLDWLAVDFVESRWNMKRLLRQLVTSATYQQRAVYDVVSLERDPNNRWLGRGPRVRLQAEMIRDQALFVSGMLVEELGGSSAWVYQPDGLWEEVEKRGTFVQDHGRKLYRRSLYSRIRRTVAPPSMLLFDMPSREQCQVKRASTNTPLQALALMNEVTYVEAAKKFAERMRRHEGSARERITWGFRQATSRYATSKEMTILLDGYERRLKRYREDPGSASKLLDQGEAPMVTDLPKPEMAALTTVASAILNLDELMNR